MIRFELDKQSTYDLIHEIQYALGIVPPQILANHSPQLKELYKALRIQLSGLIDQYNEWIDYTDDDFLRSELVKAQEKLEKYDYNNPFQRGVPNAYQNLLDLFRQRCKHLNQEYSKLRGPYRTLYCSDCHVELGPLEFKPSFLKNNNIDLSVFEDKKTNE